MENFTYDNTRCIEAVVKSCGITEEEIKEYTAEAPSYFGQLLCIPIVIDMEPTPYSSVRVDPRTMRMYVPNKEKLVRDIRKHILSYLGTRPFFDGRFPVFVESIIHISFYLPTPKSYSKKDKYLAEIKALRPIVTPDVDNVIKIINDRIKSFVIYDDSSVIGERVDKYFSIKPRIEVSVYFHTGAIPKVHEKLILKRMETWKKNLRSGKLEKIVKLLREFIPT